MYYLFDGSYSGFLCCVFESFERKEFDVIPTTSELYQADIFEIPREIITDISKAKRVQDGFRKMKMNTDSFNFYKVFLSEDVKSWEVLHKIIIAIFKGAVDILNDYGNQQVLYFSQTLQKVGRESHRMKAFIRFVKSAEGLYVAVIEPDFNVLPLIVSFFKNRYADQQWLIYDVKRKYGMMYDLNSVTEVQEMVTETPDNALQKLSIELDHKEELIQRLWQQYFKSTNIESRRNIKLHLQHVPKRYWKYLTEKSL